MPEVEWLTPGEDAALEALCGSGADAFLTGRLKHYEKRNDPNETRALSGLSPYLHFGQLSAQRVVLESKKFRKQHGAVRPENDWDRRIALPRTRTPPSTDIRYYVRGHIRRQYPPYPQAIDSFLEELVVRRELSDNFCHYNPKCAAWHRPPSRAKDAHSACLYPISAVSPLGV